MAWGRVAQLWHEGPAFCSVPPWVLTTRSLMEVARAARSAGTSHVQQRIPGATIDKAVDAAPDNQRVELGSFLPFL